MINKKDRNEERKRMNPLNSQIAINKNNNWKNLLNQFTASVQQSVGQAALPLNPPHGMRA